MHPRMHARCEQPGTLLGRRLQLHDLALNESLERLGHLLDDQWVLQPCERDGCARQQEVTRQHRRFRGVKLVDGRATTPCVSPIQHVVVHERGGVDHLSDRRQLTVLGDRGLLVLPFELGCQRGGLCVTSSASWAALTLSGSGDHTC